MEIKNIKNIYKLHGNSTVRLKGWEKHAKNGALVYVEKLDDVSFKITLLDIDNSND
jgi:aspartyl-tRNA synthetase